MRQRKDDSSLLAACSIVAMVSYYPTMQPWTKITVQQETKRNKTTSRQLEGRGNAGKCLDGVLARRSEKTWHRLCLVVQALAG